MAPGASGLYDEDVLLWSSEQADLLRRLSDGEQVNGVDWAHVIEEIEDVGRSELHAVSSLLRQAIVHLLKAQAWPESLARGHWQAEAIGFLADARDRFTPSMRQGIDLTRIYAVARTQVAGLVVDSRPAEAVPGENPFVLETLLRGDLPAIEAELGRGRERG